MDSDEHFTADEAINYLESQGIKIEAKELKDLIKIGVINPEFARKKRAILRKQLDIFSSLLRDHNKPERRVYKRDELATTLGISLEYLNEILKKMTEDRPYLFENVFGGRNHETIRSPYAIRVYRMLLKREMSERLKQMIY